MFETRVKTISVAAVRIIFPIGYQQLTGYEISIFLKLFFMMIDEYASSGLRVPVV